MNTATNYLHTRIEQCNYRERNEILRVVIAIGCSSFEALDHVHLPSNLSHARRRLVEPINRKVG